MSTTAVAESTHLTATDRHRTRRREVAALRDRLAEAEGRVALADDPHSLPALEAAREAAELRIAIIRAGAELQALAPAAEAEKVAAAARATATFAPRHRTALAAVREAVQKYQQARGHAFEVHAAAALAGGAGALPLPIMPDLTPALESIAAALAATPRGA